MIIISISTGSHNGPIIFNNPNHSSNPQKNKLSFPLIDNVRHFVIPRHHTINIPDYLENYLKYHNGQ